jgi:3-oxoadipyl-CoA thiolase
MKALYGVDSMPETGENVAEDFKVSREDQDAFAFRSQRRAARAAGAGVFAEQIVPVAIPRSKGTAQSIVERDEQLRPETTLEGLAQLKPVVRAGGTVTAGNASGINDGAAALVVASGAAVAKHGLRARARVLGFASAGVAPRIMGVGPIPAVEKLLNRLRLKVSDFDVIELNEAFASQALACVRALGLADDADHVNSNGGAIALGHPLGMSGTRIVGAAVQELLRRSGRYGLATMCVGVGQGAALAFERI